MFPAGSEENNGNTRECLVRSVLNPYPDRSGCRRGGFRVCLFRLCILPGRGRGFFPVRLGFVPGRFFCFNVLIPGCWRSGLFFGPGQEIKQTPGKEKEKYGEQAV